MEPAQKYSQAFLAEDRSRDLVNVVVTFAILETFFIFLFFTSRIMNHTANGWDVYLMIPAYLLCLANTIVCALFVQYGGAGRHVAALDPKVIAQWLKLDLAAQFTYVLSILFPKLAILCLFARVFSTKPYLYSIYFIGSVVVLTCITGLILCFTICRPFAYNWDRSVPNGYCVDVPAVYRYISIPNLLTDMCMLILPLHGVWHLHMKIIHKIGLMFTFLLGCLGMITGIVRLVYFFRTDLFADVTFQTVVPMTWTLVEPGVYLIAATLPSLRPLVRYLFQDIRLETYYSNLLDRVTRAFSANKYSEGSTANTQFSSANRHNTAVTAGNGARSAGFVKIDKRNAKSPKLSQDDIELGSC